MTSEILLMIQSLVLLSIAVSLLFTLKRLSELIMEMRSRLRSSQLFAQNLITLGELLTRDGGTSTPTSSDSREQS